MDERAIGVFDSGVGGLTVVKAITELLPAESIVYLGDTARVPYGTRSKETVTRFAVEDTHFLIEKGVKAVVIACNTASAWATGELEHLFSGMPIFNVIEPAVVEAYTHSKHGRIGIIGTPGTIASGAHERLLRQLDPNLFVVARACPLLVPVIEDGRVSGPIVESLVAEYLRPMREQGIDTLILGCTHYPLLIDRIYDFLFETVTLIDPGQALAKALVTEFTKRGLRANGNKPSRVYYVTDDAPHFRETAGRFLGEPVEIRKTALV